MKSTGAKEHRGCVLLKPEENEEVFRLIGNRCQVFIIWLFFFI